MEPQFPVEEKRVEWVPVYIPIQVSGPSSLTSSSALVDTSFPVFSGQPPATWPSANLFAGQPPATWPSANLFAGQPPATWPSVNPAPFLPAYPLGNQAEAFEDFQSPLDFLGLYIPPADPLVVEKWMSGASSMSSPMTVPGSTPMTVPGSSPSTTSSPKTPFFPEPMFFNQAVSAPPQPNVFASPQTNEPHPPVQCQPRKRHQRFGCKVCGKAHADRRALNRHLESQHEEFAKQQGIKSEKIQCQVCDYVSRADNVRRHERSQHALPAPGSGKR